MPKKKKARPRPQPTVCPCGSGGSYGECCGPLISGSTHAEDAIALMRSRYSAYCLGEAGYLWRTLHSQHPDREHGEREYCAAVERGMANARYRALRILDSRPPDAAGIAQVLFYAQGTHHKRDRSIVELSDFAREDEGWRYIVGKTRPAKDLAHDVGELSIDHWECGHDHAH